MLDKKGTTLEHIILLRGVTPNGKNAIPKMSYLVDILIEADFQHVRNLYSKWEYHSWKWLISGRNTRTGSHSNKGKNWCWFKNGNQEQKWFCKIVQEKPIWKTLSFWPNTCDPFQNDIQSLPLEKLDSEYGEEEICIGNHCLYLYLPRTAKRKNLIPTILKSCSALIWPCES